MLILFYQKDVQMYVLKNRLFKIHIGLEELG